MAMDESKQDETKKDESKKDDIVAWAIEAANRLYTDPNIRRFDPELEKRIAGKNSIFQGDHNGARARWVASYPGSRGDWGLNKGGLVYFQTELEADKIAAGIVVLKRGKDTVAARPVTEVWPKVKNANWMDLGDGEFCWVDENFNPATGNSNRYITNPDEKTDPDEKF
jgi:hypothetical protein